MSIDLIGVNHVTRVRGSKKAMQLRDINLHIEDGQRVAILGTKRSGFDEILSLICGSADPVTGHVVVTSEISWPIGETSFLSSDSTLATNLRFMARIYEVDFEEYRRRIDEVADLSDHWNDKLGGVSREAKWRFAFALGVCLPFNIYLFENPEPSQKPYRERAQAIIQELAHNFGIVISTSKGDIARQYCDRGFVLDGGKLTYYEDIEEAIAHLEGLEDEPAVVEEVSEEREEGEDEDADFL